MDINAIDADKLFIEAIGVVPWTFNYASRMIAQSNENGTLKPEHRVLHQLLAAVKSTNNCGLHSSEWNFEINDRYYWQNESVGENTAEGVFRLTATSDNWPHYLWRWEAQIKVTIDDYGIEHISSGIGTVTINYGSDDEITFTGECVGAFSEVILLRCIAHSWAVKQTTRPDRPVPAWHSRVREMLVDLLRNLDDLGDLRDTIRALATVAMGDVEWMVNEIRLISTAVGIEPDTEDWANRIDDAIRSDKKDENVGSSFGQFQLDWIRASLSKELDNI